MKKAKIVHLVQDMNPGGLERIVAGIVTGIDPARFTAELWCLTSGGPLAEEVRTAGIPVRIFGFRRYLMPGNILRLARELRACKCSIVHTHSYGPGILGRVAAWLAGVRISIHHHHTTGTAHMHLHQLVLERLASSFITSRIIACSRAVKNNLIAQSFGSEDSIIVLYNGVPESFAAPSGSRDTVLREYGLDGIKVVVTVASLTPHKGHRVLLDACPEIIRRFPDTRFVFVGAGSEQDALQARARQLQIEHHIIFAGMHRDVRPFLEAARVFVLPSLREGMGISIVEAMAKGLPVAAASTGGIPEVVKNGETGWLARPDDSTDLAKKIGLLLADPASAEAMGTRGYTRFKELFSLEAALVSLQQLYTESLDAH